MKQLFLMGISFDPFVIILSFIFVFIIFFKMKKHSNLPPGPRQIPIIGNIHNLVGSHPQRRLNELSMIYGPLIHLKLGQVSTVVASSRESAKEIMKTHDIDFASRPTVYASYILTFKNKTVSFAPYGPYWRQLRKICILELLSLKRVQSFRYIREEEVSILNKTITRSKIVNLSQLVTEMISNMVFRAVIGDKSKYQEKYLAAEADALRLISGLDFADLYPSISYVLGLVTGSKRDIDKSFQNLDSIISSILNQHMEKREKEKVVVKEEDLVDTLLRLQADKSLHFDLTDESIKALIADMLGAGNETSSSILIWVMSELMRNPRVMKRAQSEVRESLKNKTTISEEDVNELNYLQLVIKETMRLHPPLPLLLPREAGSTCNLLGFEIPYKTRILVNVWAIGRNPGYWPDPEEFKPERFEGSDIDYKGTSFELLPFGAGRRVCPGMSFGIINIQFPLAQLLFHFDWELPDKAKPKDLNMEETYGISARKKYDLELTVTPHVHTNI